MAGSDDVKIIEAKTNGEMTPPMRKLAQNFRTSRMQADFYNPLFEDSSIQMPTRTREINQYCVTPDTEILMADGTRKVIKDVKVNDQVISKEGNIRNVKKVFIRDVDEEINSIYVPGEKEPLKVSDGHRVWSIDLKDIACKYHHNSKYIQRCQPGKFHACNYCGITELNFDYHYAENLKVKDCVITSFNKKIVLPICHPTRNWNDSDKKLFFRLLGLYLSEGSLSKRKDGKFQQIVFTLNRNEKDTLGKEIKYIIKKLFDKDATDNENFKSSQSKDRKNVYDVRLYSKEIADILYKYCGEYSDKKILHMDVMQSPIEYQKILLGAFIDGDGSQISKKQQNKGIIELTTVSKNLANQLMVLSNRCNIIAYKYKAKGFKGFFQDRAINCKPAYRVKIRLKFISELVDYSCKLFECVTKKKRCRKFFYGKNWIVMPIVKKKRIKYKGKLYNLTIEEDHSYIANGIAVSNCRHYYRSEPIIGIAVDLHSEMPVTDLKLVCDDSKVKKFYDDLLFNVINIKKVCEDISLEYNKLGNVHPFLQWDEDKGYFNKVICMNPDYIEIEASPMADKAIYRLDPDEALKRVVKNRKPVELYNQLDKNVIDYINKGQKIPLSDFVVTIQTDSKKKENKKIEIPQISHLAFKLSPYEVYGTSQLFRCFKALMYKDILRRAQMAIAKRHITPIKLIKVGSDNFPAGNDALSNMEEAMLKAAQDPQSFLVTHHAVVVDYITASGKIVPLNPEFDWIDKEIMMGLGINKAMIEGSGPTFANASIGLQILINRYIRFESMLSNWIKNELFKPISKVQGFEKVDKETGDRELIIPEIEWEMMKLKDDVAQKNLLLDMQSKGLISKHSLLIRLGFDPDKEQEQVEAEFKEMKKKQEKQPVPTTKQKPPPSPGVPPVPTPPGGGALVPPIPGGPPAPAGTEKIPMPGETGALPGETLPPRGPAS